jgi:exopolysaccharide biosynthesis polyprenyl glycosylphosphotransferase
MHASPFATWDSMTRKTFRLSRLLRHAVARLNRSFDGACALIVMLMTFTILNSGRMPQGFQDFLSVRLTVKNVALVIAFVVLWHASFAICGLYRTTPDPDAPRASPWLTAFRIVLACTMGSLVLSFFTLASSSGAFDLRVVCYFWLACVAAELGGRGVIALIAHSLARHAHQIRHAVIVGSGPRALTLEQSLAARPLQDCVVLGFADTRPDAEIEAPIRDRMLSTLEGLEALLCSRPIDQVLIALPVKSCYEAIQQVLDTCERVGVEATYFPDIFSAGLARPAFQGDEDDLPAVRHQLVVDDHRLVVKRALDIVIALVGLIAVAPILLVCAIVIKVTAPGPVFFSQLRYGYNRRQFRMYKLRTMVVDAERLQAGLESQNEARGPVFKIRADPRITRCGRIMRKLSLDELPQFFNVLRGDMSLVGPRPLPARDVLRFHEAWLMRRFSVKPGLTCLWQVSGRSQTEFDQWVRQDLDYIDNWSLTLDMRILIKTVPAVLSGSGAM